MRVLRVEIRVSGSGYQLNRVEFLAIVTETEAAEIHFAVRGEPQRTAVFEFDFRAAIFSGFELAGFDDWKINKCLFKTVTRSTVDLNGTLNLTEPDDSRPGFSRC